MPAAIIVSELDYRLGDDTEIFSRLTATIPADLVGLVGDNGIGKSTFARILAGRLRASAGTVTGADGAVYIDQLLPHSTQRVDSALDIASVRVALHRALNGDATDSDFELIGDDWDIEERALAALADLGLHLSPSDLGRSLSSFSGGQGTRIGLARAALVRDSWLILDEPSNNLDEDGRGLLATLLTERRGPTLVISHDRNLLTHMSSIIEMTDRLRVYGGNFDDYETMVAAEEEAKQQKVTDAKKTHQIEKRQRIELETKLARADRKAKKDKENKRRPKIVMNGLKNFAERSAAKRRGDKAADEAAAWDELNSAKDALRRTSSVRLDLPDTHVHATKRVLGISTAASARPERPKTIVGPERIRLTGPNGAGKSTLLAAILAAANGQDGQGEGTGDAAGGHAGVEPGPPIADLFGDLDITVAAPTAHLDQQYRLPGELTVMEAVRSGNPQLDPHRVHEILAAMGLRAGRTDQLCQTLSGGERFRVALAAGLLQDPAPQLLILDEPGNNLDLSSLEALVTALEGFGGAMVIVTHDDRLAAELSVDTEWDVREFLRTESVEVNR
ncbi:ATPase components of ABC transporters with duplicated ATPase domains [Brevibacterium siliguriense]|uniref:ATPase components of ABC transporters with duplicated ATPase domains n=1 Tax=Brevibacterium siliguriense TaxID=1136497 RepID=A0A1H1TKL3_9MICO|nr:ATP-binding cassette domain-containing protein [Brevibacterium siliguriense]SDS60516.1 ATPase components of ABC transporters with duplicated ATPase domains [Brevibacterium siliguriense]